MRNRRKLIMTAADCLAAIIILGLIAGAAGYKRDGPTTESVVYVENVTVSIDGGPWQRAELPCGFEGLAPRTPVSVKAVISPEIDDAVFIKTVYSPVRIYFDDEFVFEMGRRENYPAFMEDPATEIHMIEAFGTGEEKTVRLDFLSPKSRSTLMIHPLMVGTPKELIMERSRVLGIPLIFSFVQMVGGVLLIFISVCIMFIDKKGVLFSWLGLFSLLTGMWAFGENNFSGIIFRDSALLYIVSFTGFFSFMVPLIRFTRTIIAFENPKPLCIMELFFSLSASAALGMQLTGIMSCSESMYFFHAAIPAALLILTGLVIYEYVKNRNIDARRFMLPAAVLLVTGVMELFNYRMYFTYIFSSIFQVGILIFLLIMGITAGMYIKDSIDLRNRQRELVFEKNLMDIQIKEQQSRSRILSRNEQLIRQQRHDLRHHLVAIRELADSDIPGLKDYLSTMIDSIPGREEVFCENMTVNAVISHYSSICAERGIEFSVRLAVPPDNEGITDSELCVIFGNLLENAVEACERMKTGKKFIKLNSSMQYDLLAITMDNSFNGQFSETDGKFRSSKRNDFGLGLASVSNVAQKAGGDTEFKAEGDVFMSSVYVRVR